MTGADHFWEKRDGWDVCARCGEVHSSRYIALGPCSGEQSPTSDEREIDRLRLEVVALTARASAGEAETARLRRLVTAAAAALDGLLTDVVARGFPVHPLVVYHLRKLARDLRAAPLVTPLSLDQVATR